MTTMATTDGMPAQGTKKTRTVRVRKDRVLNELIIQVVLIAFGVMFVLPFLWMVSSSLKPMDEMFKLPVTLIPEHFRFANYSEAIRRISFLRYTLNTLQYTVLCTTGALISNVFIAYGFSRVRWPGRDKVFFLVIATLMLPFLVQLVPLYLAFHRLGWLDTYKPLIVPSWFGDAYSIFLLRQFMMTLPIELDDAARIDGCSELGIFWRITIPLTKPALTVILLNYLVFTWNNFLGPLIYLRSQEKYTLSIGVQFFIQLNRAEWGLLMAAATMMTLPMIVIFFLAQRTFIEGITLTGIKG